MNPYENLTNAIIMQAVKDYRKVLHTLSICPNNRTALYTAQEIEGFFRTEYFGILTKLDPEMLIRRLNKEVTV